MNIALIGVPGSGKTRLAKSLARKLDNAKVIDRYVNDIERRTDIAIGPTTNYLGNLYVALERYARERKARLEHEVVITCGTLVETAVYMAVQFAGMTQALSDEEKVAFAPRMEASLRMFAVLYHDIMSYDYGFYLPPGEQNEETEFIDEQIRAGLEGFHLIPVTKLTDPLTRVDDVLETLNASN